METITPFSNEGESLQIVDLTIETRTAMVSIYGSLDITRDQRDLELALRMKRLLDSIVERLAQEDLPESIMLRDHLDLVKNPFL